jgi:Polyketide cyclase / dehydrase and lipid transport
MKNALDVHIRAPAAALMPLLLDHSRLPLWMEGLIESEQTSHGAPGPGTTFRQVFRAGPIRVVLTGRLTTFEPPTSFAFEADISPLVPMGPGGRILGTWRLDEVDGETTVYYSEETQVDHPLFAALAPLMAGRVRARHAAAFATLKRMVETGTSL